MIIVFLWYEKINYKYIVYIGYILKILVANNIFQFFLFLLSYIIIKCFLYRGKQESFFLVYCFFVCRFEFSYEYDFVEEICKVIFNQIVYRLIIGIICGIGLLLLGDIVDDKVCIFYEKIKNFFKSIGMVIY